MYSRLVRVVMRYPGASPVTAGYALVLASTYALVYHVLDRDDSERLLAAISTNVDNLARHPLAVLLASPLVIVARHVAVLDILLVDGLGVLGCLGWLEHRYGAQRAFGIFLAGHVGGTLISAVVVIWATSTGRYPSAIHHELDYGVSYGAIAATAALTPLVWRRLRVPWALGTVLYPFAAADWYEGLPDPTTIGHVVGASIGLVTGLVLTERWRAAGPTRRNHPQG